MLKLPTHSGFHDLFLKSYMTYSNKKLVCKTTKKIHLVYLEPRLKERLPCATTAIQNNLALVRANTN
jgi:hypothetical protein